MKPYKIHKAAKAEIARAANYYEQQRSGLGGDFRREVESTVNVPRQFSQDGAPFQNTA